MTNDATTLVQDNFSSLPIQLLSFSGQLANNTVVLNWQITQARNFERFEMERSIDGKNFNRVETVPFNSLISTYSLLDDIAAVQSKHLFYRLKLIDADGKFIYSRVIGFGRTTSTAFTVYPKPARTGIFISLTAINNQKARIKISDATGKVMIDQQKEIQKGNNVFPINTSKLKAGNYIIQAIDGEINISKFTVIN